MNRIRLHKIHRSALLLAVLLLSGFIAAPQDWLFAWTGEAELPGQLYGLWQLAGTPWRPQPRTDRYAPIAHAGVNPFGINTFLEQEVEPQKRERSVAMIAEAGFHWIRQEFAWEDIEIHGKGDFEDRRHTPYRSAWEKYDSIVDLTDQYGLELVPRLDNPPAWTRALTDTVGNRAPPDRLADWGDYVEAVVSRYRGRIRYYQLWNEPNIYDEWGEQPVDPEGYTRLLCEGYRRAKAADPDVIIVAGALATTVSLDPGPGPSTGMNDFVFLQRMYDAGAADCFDILAVNNYMLWSGPTDHRLRPTAVNFSRPRYIRDIMIANGDGATPIWITETNSNALPPDRPAAPFGRVSLEQQARYAPLAYQRAMEEWPWVGVVNFWFFKPPSDEKKDDPTYYFRMVEPDFTPLPVYHAMKSYITGLTPTLYPGLHQEDHWALAYTGEWEPAAGPAAGIKDYRRSAGPGAGMTFTFEGNRLLLAPGPDRGEIEVTIDGGPPRRLALNGRSVSLFNSWTAARHTVQLTGVTDRISVDSFTVTEPDWTGRLGAVGLLSLLIGGLLISQPVSIKHGTFSEQRQPAQ